MTEWWDPSFPYRLPIAAVDPLRLVRAREPVRLDLVFDLFLPHPGGITLVDHAVRPAPCQDAGSAAWAAADSMPTTTKMPATISVLV